MERKSLREIIEWWPQDAPETLFNLVATRWDELRKLECPEQHAEMVLELRAQAIEAAQALERDPIVCADDLIRQLAARRIRPIARGWLILALDAAGNRVAVPRTGGGMHWQQDVWRTLPDPSEVRTRLALPRGGRYLVVYGGSPEVLQDAETVSALSEIISETPVSDVTFWHLESGAAPALYSLKGGCGDRGGNRMDFPNTTQTAALALSGLLGKKQ